MTDSMSNVESRLAAIETQQARVLVLLESLAKQVGDQAVADREWRARHDLLVNGDGNGNPGLRLRVDRLEQSGERSKWALRTVAAAVVGLLGKAAAGLFGH